MKKSILLIILLCALLISSCKVKKDNVNNEVPAAPPPDFTDSSSEESIFVSGDDAEWITDFANAFEQATGITVSTNKESASNAEWNIVFGNSSHNASKKAYQLLERQLSEVDDSVGYLVFIDGRTIAIAYNGITAKDEAAHALLEDHFNGKFEPKDGLLCSDVYLLKDLANKKREEAREKQIAKIESEQGKPLADAIRRLYGLFGAETYVWMANLFDPETAAFYFSNSGRDNIGFLPDVESTNQVLDCLVKGGMLREVGGLQEALPPEMERTLVAWIQSLQSPTDGYFYHPQWGTDIETARRGRDMDWSISLLTSLGSAPLYDTPTGVPGINGTPGISPASIPLRLRSSVIATTNVVLTGGALPYYLSSTATFTEYIISLDIPNNSYSAGNKLAADHALIKKAGKEYVDILIDYLNKTQIPELGLWQRVENDSDFDPTDGVSYDSVNGLMKIACIYDFLDREMPNIDKAFDSAVKVALYRNTQEDEHVCCTYNPWATMEMLIKFERHAHGQASAEKLRERILAVAPELITATHEKLSTHAILGGGFSYNELRPCNTSQGAYTACSSVPEADVNATAVVTSSMISTMFSALGLERVFLWCTEDFYVFRDIIENLDETIKHDPPKIIPINFNEYESCEVVLGSELEPDENILVDISDHNYFSSNVVERPESTSKKDLALRTEVKNTSVGYAYKPSSTNIYIANGFQQGNCFIFESDILVESTSNEVFAQIMFAPMDEGNPSFGLNLSAVSRNGQQAIKIWDNFTGTDGIKNTNLYTGQKVGEWFKLRVEMYKVFEDDQHGVSTLKEIYAKIFINGEYVATSDAGYVDSSAPGVVKNREVAKVSISHYRKTESVVYFDNILCKKTNTEYIPTTIYNPDVPNIPDISVEEGVDYNYVAEFDDGILNDAYLHNYVNDGGLINVMSENISLENYTDRISYALVSNIGDRVSEVLKISTKKQTAYGVSSSVVRISNKIPKGTTYTFESKMFFESVAEDGCVTQLHFKDSDGRIHLSLNIMYSAEGYLYLSENNVNGTGQNKLIEGANLPFGEWFTLRVEFYRTEKTDSTRVKIYTVDAEGIALCISDINAYNASAIGSSTPLSNLEIAHQRTNTATLYIDDVSFTKTEKKYAEETVFPISKDDVLPKEPDEPSAPVLPPEPDDPETPNEPDDSNENGGAIDSDNTTDSGGWT